MDIATELLPFDTELGFEPISPVLHPSEPHAWIRNIPVFEEGLRERRVAAAADHRA